MASRDKANISDSDNLCVVCFKDVKIYSVGVCDHPVCFECSTRMRILCRQNECPICRRDLPKVVFTKKLELFSTLFSQFERSNLQNRKFGIIFCTLDIQKAYFKLLEHQCWQCHGNEKKPWWFDSFQQLKDHMRREHELFYCDLCCDNLKIFSFERPCYTRQELAYHRRKGDKNNTSHRGHPLCEFCDTRFMDNDELFRHMRRTHLFCHLCDADGKHEYYVSMEDLKRHFRDEHFLCEEGECKTMPLTAVFRSDIDLKAHLMTDHKCMSKSAIRQARTLELEFTMAPRPRTDGNRNRRPDRRDRLDDESTYTVEPGGPGGGPVNQTQMFVNPLTPDQFPALGGTSSTNPNITLVSKNYTKFSNAAFNRDDFPSLGVSSSSRAVPAVTIRANSTGTTAPEVTITRTVRSQLSAPMPKESFPALSGPSKQSGSNTVRLSVNSNNQQQPPKVSIQVNQNSSGAITTLITTSAPSTSQRTEVFPALGKSNQDNIPKAQWVQPKAKKLENKTENKALKVAPCPNLETSDLNSFPSLSRGKNEKQKKTCSVTVPVDSWVNLNNIKGNKQGKKSEQNRGENGAEKATESVSKGGGDGNNSSKKTESSRKVNQKTTSNHHSEVSPSLPSTSSLDTKLNNLKLVDPKRPDGKTQLEESNKRSKKRKNKDASDSNGNELDNKEKPKCEGMSGSNKEADTGKIRDVNDNEEQANKNGISKKRSELKIGTLSNNKEASMLSDDFPALGGAKPPPGFSGKTLTPIVKPPPGFNSSEFPSLGVSNDLTFTSSSGQSYAIIPTEVQSSYKQPYNFQSRNQNLIRRIMDVLNNSDSIRQFKSLSDNFRKGDVDAKKYVGKCVSVLGNKFDDIFPELLVLLPDVQKQQELYREMRGTGKEDLVGCENCAQVVLKKELSEHYSYHRLENHFPSLGSAQQIHSAWKK
ncbi:E3 ubiquitin-protein ligase ZNF598 [Euwallacea similis]|uniref:E3 ubiquitin-protein ligase ZNF598 n=1 Tax=Euwallacea similis TaxID=1736056 RepID=UPI00344B6A90